MAVVSNWRQGITIQQLQQAQATAMGGIGLGAGTTTPGGLGNYGTLAMQAPIQAPYPNPVQGACSFCGRHSQACARHGGRLIWEYETKAGICDQCLLHYLEVLAKVGEEPIRLRLIDSFSKIAATALAKEA